MSPVRIAIRRRPESVETCVRPDLGGWWACIVLGVSRGRDLKLFRRQEDAERYAQGWLEALFDVAREQVAAEAEAERLHDEKERARLSNLVEWAVAELGLNARWGQ